MGALCGRICFLWCTRIPDSKVGVKGAKREGLVEYINIPISSSWVNTTDIPNTAECGECVANVFRFAFLEEKNGLGVVVVSLLPRLEDFVGVEGMKSMVPEPWLTMLPSGEALECENAPFEGTTLPNPERVREKSCGLSRIADNLHRMEQNLTGSAMLR